MHLRNAQIMVALRRAVVRHSPQDCGIYVGSIPHIYPNYKESDHQNGGHFLYWWSRGESNGSAYVATVIEIEIMAESVAEYDIY